MEETNKLKTAPYKIRADDTGGNRYRFFCELSGMEVCITEPVKADTSEEEARLAWKQDGREHFNRCHKCGRWVSNAMYNVDTLHCVKCSPIENPPAFCPYCGKPVTEEKDEFCRSCGRKLFYERGMDDGE